MITSSFVSKLDGHNLFFYANFPLLDHDENVDIQVQTFFWGNIFLRDNIHFI